MITQAAPLYNNAPNVICKDGKFRKVLLPNFYVDEVLNQFAETLRQKATPASPPAFQDILRSPDAAGKAEDNGEAEITNFNQLLQAEAKRIIENLKAMRQLLCDGHSLAWQEKKVFIQTKAKEL